MLLQCRFQVGRIHSCRSALLCILFFLCFSQRFPFPSPLIRSTIHVANSNHNNVYIYSFFWITYVFFTSSKKCAIFTRDWWCWSQSFNFYRNLNAFAMNVRTSRTNCTNVAEQFTMLWMLHSECHLKLVIFIHIFCYSVEVRSDFFFRPPRTFSLVLRIFNCIFHIKLWIKWWKGKCLIPSRCK